MKQNKLLCLIAVISLILNCRNESQKLSISSENIVRVTDFSVKPNSSEDVTLAISKAIDKCREYKNVRLVFPKGVYNFKTQKSMMDFELLMQSKLYYDTEWGLEEFPFNKAMSFKNLDSLTIDGQGSTFIFHGLVQPFEFLNCNHLTLTNFIVDWQRPLFSIGKVLDNQDNILEVEFFDDFPVKGGEPVWSYMDYDPKTKHIGVHDDWRLAQPMEYVRPQVLRFKSRAKPPIDNYLVLRHVGNYRPGIHLLDCSEVKITDVKIHSVPGMGVIGHRCHNVSIKRLEVRPKNNRIMSTNTDATHFISCTGTITIDDCYFEGMGDDATNLHGFYFYIKKQLDDRTVLAYLFRGSKDKAEQDKVLDFPMKNDTIEFVYQKTLKTYAVGEVESVDVNYKERNFVIRFKNPLPESFQEDHLIADATQVAQLRFINCKVRNIRARAILFQSRGAVIENNRFEYCTGTGIHIDCATGWMESIGTRNVTIRNNQFVNCGYGSGTYRKTSGIAILTECEESAIGVHKNIRIENNSIKGVGKRGIYISCADSVLVKKNEITNVDVGIFIEYAKNVELRENVSDGIPFKTGKNCEKITSHNN